MRAHQAISLLVLILATLGPDGRSAAAAVSPVLQTWEASRSVGEVRSISGRVTYFYVATSSGPDPYAADSIYFFRATDLALEHQWLFLPAVPGHFSTPVITQIWDVGDVDGNGTSDVALETSRYNTSNAVPGKPAVYVLDLARGPLEPIATWEDPDDTTAYEIASLGVTFSETKRLGVRRSHYCPLCGGVGQYLTSLLVYALDDAPLAVQDEPPIASPGFTLRANAPNPFRAETVIAYVLMQPSTVRLTIYDVSGRAVLAGRERAEAPGSHTYRWDGRDDAGASVPPGVYVYELRVNGETRARKSVLLR